MKKSGVFITKDISGKIIKSLMALPDTDVLVGIPDSGPVRAPEPGQAAAMNNATIGYISEYGSPAANIPARPWLIPGVVDAQKRLSGYFKQAGEAALEGNQPRIGRIMHAAGLVAVNTIRARMTARIPPPLAPATLANRRARGRTGTVPLIDTGQFRNAINYVVRYKGQPI